MIGFHQRGRGEPLLLLTGMVVSRADWPEPWLQALEQSFRLVLMDNRGTGESRPAPAAFSMSDLASDAADVLDQCGVEAAHVFGNSMGGQIALTLAAERPDRVRRLVVSSTKAGEGPLLSPAPELLAKLAALSQDPKGRSELPRLLGGPGFADRQEDVTSSAPIGAPARRSPPSVRCRLVARIPQIAARDLTIVHLYYPGPATSGPERVVERATGQELPVDMRLALAAAAPLEVTPPGTRRRRRRRRLLPYLLTFWFLVTLNFALPRAMPGDPIESMLATSAVARGLTEEERAAAARYYGFDQPLLEQYGSYMVGLLHGDLGISTRYSRPVGSLLAERLPWSLLLATTAVGLGTALGAMGGIYAGWRRGKRADRILVALSIGSRGVPPFFLGSLALFAFSVELGWFPLFGATSALRTSSGLVADVADVAWHLALPAAVASTVFAANAFLVMRAGVVGELGSDYLLLGRAKGLRERRLEYGYTARNAALPVVALIALELGASVSGLIFVETVFAYPGLGRLLFDSVTFRDYSMLQGCFLVITLGVMTMNFLADVVSRRLDPRTAP